MSLKITLHLRTLLMMSGLAVVALGLVGCSNLNLRCPSPLTTAAALPSMVDARQYDERDLDWLRERERTLLDQILILEETYRQGNPRLLFWSTAEHERYGRDELERASIHRAHLDAVQRRIEALDPDAETYTPEGEYNRRKKRKTH